MDVGQVEAFLAVETFGGFRKAADALRLTQPAVSARIKALEDSLGVALFERARGRPSLSAAGRALRPHAEQIVHALARARQAVHDLQPSAGAVQIAAALSICTYLLPDVLTRFQAAHPRVMITVRSGHSKEVLEMVLRGEADIGLARSLHHPSVHTVSLRDDPLVLVGNPTVWPMRTRRARLEEVANRPLIFFDRGSSDWTLSHGLFRRAGLVPNVVLEVETIETAKKMVERGMGLAFLPHLAVAPEVRRGRLAAITIVDAEPLTRSLDVIHPLQRALSGEAKALLATLRTAVAEGRPARAPPPPAAAFRLDARADVETIWTVGHSTRTLDDFIALLRHHAITRLADVRTIPRSRSHPHFNRETLPGALAAAGIGYVHLAPLGGFRRPRPDSINTGWRNTSFRGYADHMQTPAFAAALEELIALAAADRVAVMCAEAVRWRCHRSLLADALVARGVGVRHIENASRAVPHTLTAFARVHDGRVRYPGSQGSLPLGLPADDV